MTGSLIVLLHGVGASGADLVPLGRMLGAESPQAGFVAPDAPEPFDQAPTGRQWFSLAGVGLDNLAGRIERARPKFDATVRNAIASAGFDKRLDRVAFVGFSQGAIMALGPIATGRWTVAGIATFAGMLPPGGASSPAVRGKRILMVHGEDDPVIPVVAGRMSAAMLERAGASVRFMAQAGVAHEIAPEGLRLAGTFVRDIFGVAA